MKQFLTLEEHCKGHISLYPRLLSPSPRPLLSAAAVMDKGRIHSHWKHLLQSPSTGPFPSATAHGNAPWLLHQPRDVICPVDVGADGPRAPLHGREMFSGEKRDSVPSEEQIAVAPTVLPRTISQTKSLYLNPCLRLGLRSLEVQLCCFSPYDKGGGDEIYM